MAKGIWKSPWEFVEFNEPRGKKKGLGGIFASRQNTWDVEGSFSSYLPDPDPILRSQGRDIKVYRGLLTDAHVGSVVDSRKAGVLTLEWMLERGKASKRHHDFIAAVLAKFDMHRVITDILEAPLYGFAPMEIVWERADGMIAPSEFLGKPSEWFRYSLDNELLFISKDNTEGEPVPDLKFIVPRNDPTYINPYGKRILSRCFWPVTFKRGGFRFWAMFLEKYGMPHLIGTYPSGTEEAKISEMLSMLEDMIQDAVAVIPEGSRVESVDVSSSGNAGRAYKEFLEFGNREVSKAVLGQTLTTEMQSTGSYAASQTHFAVRQEIVDSDRRIVEDTMNTLIGYIYEVNFSADQEKPMFQLFEQKDVQQERAERDKTLTEAGVRFTKEYFQDEYDLDEKHFEVTDPAPPGGGGGGEFSEAPSQKTLDALEDTIGGMDAELQAQAEAALSVIFSLAEKSGSFEEFSRKLADAYPELDTEALSKKIEQASFISKVWGGMNPDD